ncbi:PREDICTED: RPA-interacting protein [Nanorana parkeri]|uniref:RPA-interacting protein n=1 Tax=Nanorana parkeri TaxID=125878 RepID=UPI000855063F|nr:PREDICTED: RPA-interacting protein [Nanorana parkeri]
MMEAGMRHRALYKGTTPPWKETYRKRCVERLKSNRSRLLDKFRQVGETVNGGIGGSFLVQEVMEEEWKAMQSSSGSFPSLWKKEDFSQALGILQDHDELVTLEEIRQELLLEEQAMVAEIESILQFEEDSLYSVVGMNAEHLIVCPVCNRNYLTVTSCFVLCQCGVYINCKSQGMNIEKLQSLLELNLSAHSNCCSERPVFSIVLDAEGVSSLFMSCTVCDAMGVII